MKYSVVCTCILLVLSVSSSIAGTVYPGIPDDDTMRFSIYMEGNKVGFDQFDFNRFDTGLVVNRKIKMDITYIFYTAYSYRHRSESTWQNGRLTSLDAFTNKNGTRLNISAKVNNGSLVIDTNKSTETTKYSQSLVPTTWWNSRIVKVSQLLDTQYGKSRAVSAAGPSGDTVDVSSRTIKTKKYEITGDLNLTLWYGSHGELQQIQYTRNGYEFTHKRVN